MKPLSSRIRNDITVEVCQIVLAPEEERLFDEKVKLIQSNHLLGGGRYSYTVKGKIVVVNPKAGRIEKYKPIHKSLLDQALKLQELEYKVMKARNIIFNSLSPLLVRCESAQDVRDALPNVVATRLYTLEIGGLDRTREQGYMFTSDPDKMRTYNNMLEVLYYYMANRLVY